MESREINGYKIMKSIGKGKFSTVYYGEDQNSQPVAVKQIKIFDMMDPKQREKCLKEVELMKPLKHPNIIQYLDSFTYNNELIIITEWASKGDLKKVIKYHIDEDLPIEEHKIWQYVLEISSALKHMHEKKIMHRDLKPANIFVSHDNSLKVGDLGLGRAFTSETLEAHSKVGTPLYMPPELLNGEGYQFNADVWSLGCIIYELAELRSPFKNQNQKMSLVDLFNNISRGEYKSVSPKYSPELIDLISKTILVNPRKRLNSAQVFQIAQENLSRSNNGPKIDCIITMDDIINKLNLLDYSSFCRISGNRPIHKFYFAFEDKSPQKAQFYHFLQICYWLMNLSKLDKNKQKAITQAKSMIDWRSPEDACNKFIKDITGFGIREQIEPKSILQSYGQGVCYLLNILLNRELIRINFKFQPAGDVELAQQDKNQTQAEEVQEDDRLLKPNPQEEEDIQETHDFERSLVFKRGAKKPGVGNTKLLEKIREIDEEDFNMIHSKVDPYDWQTEVIRVEKKLGDLSQHLKEAKKKSSFENFQKTRIITPRINEYTKFLKPLLYKLYTEIDSDIRAIEKGEQRVNSSISEIKNQYSQQNIKQIQLNERYTQLSTNKNIQSSQLQRIQSRIQELVRLSNNGSGTNNTNQQILKAKNAIQAMKRDIKLANINIELMTWQIRESQKKDLQKEFDVNVEEEF